MYKSLSRSRNAMILWKKMIWLPLTAMHVDSTALSDRAPCSKLLRALCCSQLEPHLPYLKNDKCSRGIFFSITAPFFRLCIKLSLQIKTKQKERFKFNFCNNFIPLVMASAMEQSSSINNIYPFKDVKSSIDPILNYDKGKSGNVLIIDNGK